MSTPDPSAYRQQLLAKRSALLAQLAQLRGGASGRAEASAEHFAARQDSPAQMATERDLELALDTREMEELSAIDAALSRLQAGDYGLCHDCGTEIPAARLQATPEALRCVSCQEKFEHQH